MKAVLAKVRFIGVQWCSYLTDGECIFVIFHIEEDRISMKLKNNPFSRIADTRPTFASSNSKLILRESRLSFSSGLLSAPLGNASKDNPFSASHSHSGNSLNSITKPNNKGK